MPLDIVEHVEALGIGKPGHPHVTRALARLHGHMTIDDTADGPPSLLTELLANVAAESSDLIGALSAGLLDTRAAKLTAAHLPFSARCQIRRELDQLIDVLAGLNGSLFPDESEGENDG